MTGKYGSLGRLRGDDDDYDDHKQMAALPAINGGSYFEALKEEGSQRDANASSTTNSIDAADDSSVVFNDVPLPEKLAPLLKRLADLENLNDDDILSIVFIVRIADAMHRCSYATFLTRSFVEELSDKLDVNELDLEIEPAALRWSFRQGAWMTYHRIAVDYDGSAMQQLSKLALGVLDDSIGVEKALHDIWTMEESIYTGLEGFVRDFPGRIVILPTLAMTGSVVYFRGTLTDMACCLITGTVAGMIHYLCSVRFPQLAGVQDILVSISTAMVATAALVIFPTSTCFSAQILGTLFWFLYGISFMLSIYEMTQSLVLTGLTRFAVAILNSFILAFGVVIGVWLAFWGGPDRFDRILASCDNLEYKIDSSWYGYLYPIIALGALMQMRVAPRFWIICLVTQLVAVKSQYYLDTVWHQPLFVFNFLPAYLATLTAHLMIDVCQRFNWTQLVVKRAPSHAPPRKAALPVRDLSLYRKNGGGSERIVKSIRFIDQGWADDVHHGGGTGRSKSMRGGYERTNLYERENRVHYQRSDLWFCLVPALYLLVPGSSVWKFAFFSIIDAAFDAGHTASLTENDFSLQSMISGVFVVAIGQTLGVRLALVTLWVITNVWSSLTGRNVSASLHP